jgi:hypothetical protein
VNMALKLGLVITLLATTRLGTALAQEDMVWAQALKAAPGECSMVGFPATANLPSHEVPLFAQLPLSRADANFSPMGGCYSEPPQYRIALGDPSITTTAVFSGSSGRLDYDHNSRDAYGRCRPFAGGFCTTMDALNFTEYFYMSVKGHEAVVRHNILRQTREDFWHVVWYDFNEDMSYAVELSGGVARRVGAPATMDVLDHLPHAQTLADLASAFIPVRLNQ